jgi:hypothetical protein
MSLREKNCSFEFGEGSGVESNLTWALRVPKSLKPNRTWALELGLINHQKSS